MAVASEITSEKLPEDSKFIIVPSEPQLHEGGSDSNSTAKFQNAAASQAKTSEASGAKQLGGRVLAVASGGGHWLEMCRLYPVFENLDVAFVSVSKAYAEQVPNHRFYTVRDVTRWDRWGLVVLAGQLLRILLIERPTVVITTGSAPGLFALTIAKLALRARTMWIDSIANCEQLSSSGMRARHVADVWLTQWPSLERPNGPAYWGAVL